MKKIISFVFILCLCLFYRLEAQNPVTETETKTAAVNYAQHFLQCKNLSSENVTAVYSYEESSKTLMREVVFDNGLSILLSGYKTCLPVLLYSTNNNPVLLDIEILPDGLRDFVQNYAGALSFVVEGNRNLNMHPDWVFLLGTGLSDAMTESGIVYGPLLTTLWGQDYSNKGSDCHAYNYFIKETNNQCSCDTCPTGCVATAMAQIMKYWNYPVYRANQVEQFDWCNMPDELDARTINPYYERERNAVARLLAACGSASETNYCFMNDCQSFAWPVNARNGLVDTFGYHSDAVRRLRSSYSTKTWKKMLADDIKVGRPVLYGGISWQTNDYELGGHAFVCDGYNENTEKFHFNWGHSGSYNEVWCTVDSIIEGSYNWNHLERAVFNIYPNIVQDYCDYELPLETHYLLYYNISGNTIPDPYANVPKTFTRLTSVPNDTQFPSSWRTIPSGATSEYVAHEEVLLRDGFCAEPGCNFYVHIVPCESCNEDKMMNDTADVAGVGSGDTFDTFTTPKSLETSDSGTHIGTLLRVYPNPTEDILFVKLHGGAGIASVTLYDLQGRAVETRHGTSLQDGTAKLNVKSIPAGVYVLRVTDTDGKEYHRKIVRK